MTVLAERPQEVGAEVIRRRSRRPLVALLLAGIALAAAIVGAIGPAVHEQALYRWPPSVLPDTDPVRAWYTPLLLSNRVPASIDVSLPCVLPPPLPGAGATPTVLATGRDPVRAEGLSIRRVEGSLRFSVGSRHLASVAWPPPPNACPYPVRVANGALMLPGVHVRTGSSFPEGMPTVSSLFSELDLRDASQFTVTVKTRTFATTPSDRQVIANLIAALLALAAIALVVGRPNATVGRALRAVRNGLAIGGLVDAVVIGVLLVWFVLSPVFVDDGWIWVRQRNFFDVGAFSNYYDTYGANIPLIYWLEWAQHWLVGITDELIFLRIPSLLALIATWIVSRWCYRSVVGNADSSAGRWTLAAAFLLLAMAWDMTLRPEPFVCLLVASSLAAVLSFVKEPRIAPLAVAAGATVLAVTAHPAGITAAAPLLAASPQIVGVFRRRLLPVAGLAATAIAAIALTVVLIFLDTDVGSWLEDRRLFEFSEYYRSPWWWEPARYTELVHHGWATPVRHLSVAAVLVTVLIYAVHQRRVRSVSVIPSRSLAFALALFVLTPSKNAWHFGALAGLGSVAAAAETVSLLRSTSGRESRRVIALVLAFVTAIAAMWAWLMSESWNALDLQTTTWRDVLQRFELTPLIPLFGFLLLVAAILVTRRRRDHADLGPRVAAWSLPVAAAPIVVMTLVTISVDATRAPGWAPARQYLKALAGREQCGVADVMAVQTDARSRSATTTLASVLRRDDTRALIVSGIAPYFPCARPAGVRRGVVDVPELEVVWPPSQSPIPSAYPASSFGGLGDLYRLRLLARRENGPWAYDVVRSIPGVRLASAAWQPAPAR